MKLYEFTCLWNNKGVNQISFIKCNAKSQKDAEGLIHMYVPFHVELSRAKKYEYSKQTGDDIILWYFDKDNKEHHDIYKGTRI